MALVVFIDPDDVQVTTCAGPILVRFAMLYPCSFETAPSLCRIVSDLPFEIWLPLTVLFNVHFHGSCCCPWSPAPPLRRLRLSIRLSESMKGNKHESRE